MKKVDWLVALIFLAVVWIPGYVFFASRGGFGFLDGLSLRAATLTIFPLLGLYAFFLVWFQVMLGSNMDWLRPIAPATFTFHKFEGGLALLVALLHPGFILFGVGIANYFHFAFVDKSKIVWVLVGELQLFLLFCAVMAGLLRRMPKLRPYWYYVHYLNYLVFILVFLHSWFLGSDVSTSSLRYLWIFYLLTFLITVSRRHIYPLVVRDLTAQSPGQ